MSYVSKVILVIGKVCTLRY